MVSMNQIGQVKVTLLTTSANDYLIADTPLNSATKTVFDNDPPILSIVENSTETTAGSNVEFELILDRQPVAEIAVRVHTYKCRCWR